MRESKQKCGNFTVIAGNLEGLWQAACLYFFDKCKIGADFALKVLNWNDDTIIRLQLWDIAGICSLIGVKNYNIQ